MIDRRVAGFVDFLDDGLLDMLFVHPDFGRPGLARMIVARVKREGNARQVVRSSYRWQSSREASARAGFRVVASRQHKTVDGQTVPNYEIRYELGPGPRELAADAEGAVS